MHTFNWTVFVVAFIVFCFCLFMAIQLFHTIKEKKERERRKLEMEMAAAFKRQQEENARKEIEVQKEKTRKEIEKAKSALYADLAQVSKEAIHNKTRDDNAINAAYARKLEKDSKTNTKQKTTVAKVTKSSPCTHIRQSRLVRSSYRNSNSDDFIEDVIIPAGMIIDDVLFTSINTDNEYSGKGGSFGGGGSSYSDTKEWGSSSNNYSDDSSSSSSSDSSCDCSSCD